MFYPRLAWIVSIPAIIFATVGNPRFVRGEDQSTSIKESTLAKGPTSPSIESSTEQSSTDSLIQEALDGKSDLDIHALPLSEAVEQLKQDKHLPLELDMVAVRDAGIDPKAATVTLNVRGVSLRSALSLLLSQLDLTYVVRNEMLQVTSKDKAGVDLGIAIYDVRDLLRPDAKGQPDYASLINLVTSTVERNSWADVGGPGSADVGPMGTILISQTQHAQDQIRRLFAAMRHANDRMKANDFAHPIDIESTIADKKIERILSDKINTDFRLVRLMDLADELQEKYGLNVVVDIAAIKQFKLDPINVHVNFGGNGITLRSALKLALESVNLLPLIDHEVLLITTKERSNADLYVRLYPIGDFIQWAKSASGSTNVASDDIAQIITNALVDIAGTWNWTAGGGNGTLQVYDTDDGPIMIISQTQEVHERIVALLNQLRQVHRQQEAATQTEPAKAPEPESIVLRVYDLRISGPSGPAMTPQEVADLVKALVEPKSWSQPDVFVRGVTGKLVVKQVPSVHRQIEKLLDQLGASVPTTASKSPSANAGGGF